ncbi:MAG: CBS domain-containing protein [Zetaproteobacteria bacterium CG_4_9_14_3_um_filter_53_7]|nr:MAG: CBS domain-containing protein [Zetaproteobacteria bacterium CG_4_9_14_3_um_filter_53_7]
MIITSQIQRNVATIDENSSVLDAAKQMATRFIGSIAVTSAYGIKGLFTERELMMRVIGEGLDPARVRVGDVTNQPMVSVKPDADVERCLELMKENRCRHLVVFDGETFIGIVSLRDMVALLLDEKEHLITRLKEYITS